MRRKYSFYFYSQPIIYKKNQLLQNYVIMYDDDISFGVRKEWMDHLKWYMVLVMASPSLNHIAKFCLEYCTRL